MVRERALEAAGLLCRNVFAGYPLHVEYSATEWGVRSAGSRTVATLLLKQAISNIKDQPFRNPL
jgi:DNA-binding HxlR family transcriptional regulator